MTPRFTSFTVLLFLVAGCVSRGHQVYVASDTSLGVIGSTNTAQTSGKLLVGYDRAFVTLVPKKQDNGDVMSVYNCTNLEIKGLKISKFYERVATGAAAKAVVAAIDPDSGSDPACSIK